VIFGGCAFTTELRREEVPHLIAPHPRLRDEVCLVKPTCKSGRHFVMPARMEE
jgi:hypothetical protein